MWLVLFSSVLLNAADDCGAKRGKAVKCSALDTYLLSIDDGSGGVPAPTPGSLYRPGSRVIDLGRDFRSAFAGDVVTVIVSDRATAVARGSTNTARQSNVTAGVQAALGPLRVEGPLGRLAGSNAESQLKGQGETSRSLQLSTTVTALVERVLPNGNLVIRGAKEITVNSERQVVEVRGIVRPEDLQANNSVLSDRLAMLELRLNGRGVVGDAIRRPFILYRILMGLLPF